MEELSILIVDDEPSMRMGVSRTLKDFTVRIADFEDEVRFVTSQAETGEEAVAAIEAHAPDILLLDHKLPGISGLDVLQKIESRDEILTVMITAYASLPTAITATKRGAYDVLAKPFTPDELRTTVRKAAKHILLQRHARRLAEEKRQVRFQFISVLAHELKAPIGAVQGYLRILRDQLPNVDQAKREYMIDRSLLRLEGMQKLIFDLLDLTRIESGRKKRNLIKVDLAAVARDCIETFQTAAEERQIAVELHVPRVVALTADRNEIEIILNNLISNAVKYNRDGGRIDVTLAETDAGATLEVTDTGIGMSPEEVDRLFDEFVRIKNAKTRNIIGSGLGLSIVKRLARLYNGDVTVQSQPDVGTTFRLNLGRC